jgi:hypothetical protein
MESTWQAGDYAGETDSLPRDDKEIDYASMAIPYTTSASLTRSMQAPEEDWLNWPSDPTTSTGGSSLPPSLTLQATKEDWLNWSLDATTNTRGSSLPSPSTLQATGEDWLNWPLDATISTGGSSLSPPSTLQATEEDWINWSFDATTTTGGSSLPPPSTLPSIEEVHSYDWSTRLPIYDFDFAHILGFDVNGFLPEGAPAGVLQSHQTTLHSDLPYPRPENVTGDVSNSATLPNECDANDEMAFETIPHSSMVQPNSLDALRAPVGSVSEQPNDTWLESLHTNSSLSQLNPAVFDTLSGSWTDLESSMLDAQSSVNDHLLLPAAAQTSTTSDSTKGLTPGVLTPSTSSSSNSSRRRISAERAGHSDELDVTSTGDPGSSQAPLHTIDSTLQQWRARESAVKSRKRGNKPRLSGKKLLSKQDVLNRREVKSLSACIRCQAMHEPVCLVLINPY